MAKVREMSAFNADKMDGEESTAGNRRGSREDENITHDCGRWHRPEMDERITGERIKVIVDSQISEVRNQRSERSTGCSRGERTTSNGDSSPLKKSTAGNGMGSRKDEKKRTTAGDDIDRKQTYKGRS